MSESQATNPIDTLRALQQASLAQGVGDNSLVAFQNHPETIVKAFLTREGYDLKGNDTDAALRVWQVRNGLHGSGLTADGKPDLVTQMLMSRAMEKGEPAAVAQAAALDDLTRLANGTGVPANGNKDGQTHGLDKLFAAAGTVPPPAAQAVSSPPEDVLGNFIRDKKLDAAPSQPATSPDLGQKLGEGLDAARDAGGKALDGARELGGKVVDGVKDTFHKLGERHETPKEAQARAERDAAAKAQLQATQDAIKARAAQMREGAGNLATKAGESISSLGDRLKGLLNSGDAPAAPDASASTPAAAQTPAKKPAPRFSVT